MRGAICAAVCAALIGTPGIAQGQTAPPREGLWWGVGLGFGWAYVSCDICRAYRNRGLSGSGRIGGTLGDGLLLGGELNGWTRSQAGVDEYLGTIGVTVGWYPNPAGGFHLKGGFAYVTYRIDDGESALTSTGFGPELGLGYDVRVARRFSLQPYIDALVTLPTGTLDIDGDRQADGVSLSLIQTGLAVHVH